MILVGAKAWVLVVCLGLCSLTPARRTEAQAPEPRMSGTYVLAEPMEAARRRVSAAIERAASRVSFLIRAFACDRLRASNPVHRTLSTEVRGQRIVIALDRARFESRDGRERQTTIDGTQVNLLQQVSGSRIYQSFRTDHGTRRGVFTFSEDGRWLWLDVTVTSYQLPLPLAYRLVYRRR